MKKSEKFAKQVCSTGIGFWQASGQQGKIYGLNLYVMKTIGMITLLFTLAAFQSSGQAKRLFDQTVLPKGNKTPDSYFTGNVWVYPLAQDSLAYWSIAKVAFEAGAHSNWHTHSGKQVLVITEGIGYLKENGKPLQILRKGDVVTIQPGVKHWHGATPESVFVQVVMNPEIKNGVVTWLERVTDQEYHSKK